MTTGFQGSNNNDVDVIVLIAGATAANVLTVPAAVLSATPAPEEFFDLRSYRSTADRPIPDVGTVVIFSTAGTDVLSLGPCRAFSAHSTGSVTAHGGPMGIGTDVDKGYLNDGDGFAESAPNQIHHREDIPGLSRMDGFGILLGAIGGTGTVIRVELHLPKYPKVVR